MLQRRSIEISMDSIHPNPDQPRKYFSEEELAELKETFKYYVNFFMLSEVKEGNDISYLLN